MENLASITYIKNNETYEITVEQGKLSELKELFEYDEITLDLKKDIEYIHIKNYDFSYQYYFGEYYKNKYPNEYKTEDIIKNPISCINLNDNQIIILEDCNKYQYEVDEYTDYYGEDHWLQILKGNIEIIDNSDEVSYKNGIDIKDAKDVIINLGKNIETYGIDASDSKKITIKTESSNTSLSVNLSEIEKVSLINLDKEKNKVKVIRIKYIYCKKLILENLHLRITRPIPITTLILNLIDTKIETYDAFAEYLNHYDIDYLEKLQLYNSEIMLKNSDIEFKNLKSLHMENSKIVTGKSLILPKLKRVTVNDQEKTVTTKEKKFEISYLEAGSELIIGKPKNKLPKKMFISNNQEIISNISIINYLYNLKKEIDDEYTLKIAGNYYLLKNRLDYSKMLYYLSYYQEHIQKEDYKDAFDKASKIKIKELKKELDITEKDRFYRNYEKYK